MNTKLTDQEYRNQSPEMPATNLEKFLVASKISGIEELAKNDLTRNFRLLQNEYSSILENYHFSKNPISSKELEKEIEQAIEQQELFDEKEYLFISMSQKRINQIFASLSIKERKTYFNFTNSYIETNMCLNNHQTYQKRI